MYLAVIYKCCLFLFLTEILIPFLDYITYSFVFSHINIQVFGLFMLLLLLLLFGTIFDTFIVVFSQIFLQAISEFYFKRTPKWF